MPERVSIKDVRFYMRNVRTRMPFKYGVATLTAMPILHVAMAVESADGRVGEGVAGDILPPKWFDKDPVKDYATNVEDLLFAARAAADAYKHASRTPRTVFDIWRDGYAATLAAGDARGLNHLTSGHGSSLMERALIDAVGRLRGLTYHRMLTANTPEIDFGALHAELRHVTPADVIAETPLTVLRVRHTVGLADPIRTGDIAPDDRLNDGLPQSLEEYVRAHRLTYFKIKVGGDLEGDLDRLRAIAAVLDAQDRPYRVTLDGNEQYKTLRAFLELVTRMEEDAALKRLYDSILFIEQPLERSIALDASLASGIRAASGRKPMLIDESDGDLDTFKQAVSVGYRGVSSKNCKGLIKALANLALTRHFGEAYFMSGEDLSNLPVVPLHQDLAHLAALGIPHAERNGHHYVHGLDHLSDRERDACRARHGSLYQPLGKSLILAVRDGKIDLASLQIPGLGVDGNIDTADMTPLEDWRFETLDG